MMKTGSSGGGVSEHDNDALSQVHRATPSCIADGCAMHDD